MGSWSDPSRTGRVLADGTSQIYQRTYNANGFVTSTIDPLGRSTAYTYASNGIDLAEVRQTTGANDLLATFSNYTVGHQPQTQTDAAGQTTTMTYNADGQVLTVTNAKSETTTYAYDTDGRLTSVTGALTGDVTTMTYDAYGRTRTVTSPDSYTVTIDYDAFDRRTKVTYPDASFEAWTYDRLDLATSRDRLGRTTRYYYDPLRRLVATRDPLGRTISQEWCNCGTLETLIDANGNATRWVRDAQNRVVSEVRANGAVTAYTYETGTSRLKTITDPKEQVTTYAYALDDQAVAIQYTNVLIATPSVAFEYDTVYSRLSSATDGTGTTLYTYRSVGSLGRRLDRVLRKSTRKAMLAVSEIKAERSQIGRTEGRDALRVATTGLEGPMAAEGRERWAVTRGKTYGRNHRPQMVRKVIGRARQSGWEEYADLLRQVLAGDAEAWGCPGSC